MRILLLFVLIGMSFFVGIYAQRRSRGLVDESKETQSYFEFLLGPEYCFADPTESPFNQQVYKNFNLSVGYRRLFPNNLGYKVDLGYCHLTGCDSVSLNSYRRYSFSTNAWKASLVGIYTIIIGRRYYYRSTPNSIYGFLGVGWLATNADLNYDPNFPIAHYIYHKNYNSPVIPFGGGYHYDLNNGFMIGVEANYNFPFSDYVDGFKPPSKVLANGKRVVSKSNDIFGGISFSISYLIRSDYLNRR